MNEGTYNNVIRSNSPFSPMTPSTPNTYKTNVNRTKTRKWVEAKVQNYDGDDWGNEYEDEYDEPEPEPAPPAQPTSRIAALRQQSRTFPQPAGAVDSNAQGPLGTRGPNGPPSLHIQTGVSPRLRPVEATSSAPGQSRFPPRESSVTRQEVSGPRDMGAPMPGSRPGSGSSAHPLPTQRGATPTGPGRPSHFARPADIYNRVEAEREKERRSVESNRPSIEGGSSRTDGARSSTEQRRRTSFENHDGSDASRGQKPTLAAVDEQKSEYGSSNLGGLGDGNEANQGHANPPRLSSGPKLPDLARMSGFGDDFFSTSGGYGSLARPSLSPVSDNQPADAAAKIGPSAELEDRRRNTAGLSDEKHPPSALEGPKLEPNPRIIMPSLDGDLEPKKTDIAGTSGQPAPPRPQLPGTWVSETVSAGSASPAPIEKTEGLGQASLGSTANTDVSPMSKRHAEPADLEPTTTVRQLPSTQDDSKAEQENKATHKSGEGSFDSPTGKHDDAVASKVIAAGPGHHPTPQSLPPLKTENPLAPPNAAHKDGQETSGPKDMASRTSGYRDSPSHLYSNQQSAATTGSSFTPTAPLNPRRSVVAPADLVTPAIQERKSTMSTVDTASPEKESDKLREEIIKSLSASPATTPDASAILGSANNGFDPTPGELTRESTYLSGVYDDYLALAEEKSLQETGQLLKQGPKLADHGPEQFEATSGPSVQQGNSFPDIAPLSPRRSPEQETVRRPRRFSWERSSEKAVPGPDGAKSNVLAPPPDLIPSGQGENKSAAPSDLGAAGASPGSLHVQADDTGTVSHQVSQVSSRAPGELSSTIPEPSPLSFTTTERSPQPQNAVPDASRLSLADEKEKVLVQSSSNPSSIEGHPALANPIELTPSESPAVQPTPTAQSTQQAKVMAFRDILNIASIELRIQKFDETRDQFYSMESGLSNWIAYMKSQPDHGTGTISLGGQPVLAQGQLSPSGVQPPTQQPYYQQYLNASNPGAPPAQPGRVASGNLQHMFTGQPMSSFGSSSNQVGAKSKELLHTAGAFGNKGIKSGMKLFNKGKNKLRGTGDKVFF